MTLPPPDYENDRYGIRLWCADCMSILPLIPKGEVDAVICDPPFGVGNFVQITGRIRGRGNGHGESVNWNDAPPPPEFFDILKQISKHRIIWGANFFNCFEDRGGAIVWIKKQSMPNFSKADIASCTHFQKTETVEIPWTNFTVTHQAASDHPCERPVSLYSWCIKYLPPCDTFCDPYMGSGSVGVAAVKLGCRFMGIEIHRPYFDIAVRRIEQAIAEQESSFLSPDATVKPDIAQGELGI